MGTRLYNFIAGTSVERLAALSDGVFAVAMTLLVLDLHTPAASVVHSDADLLHALRLLAPQLLVYMMSFLTLGIFWVGQQTQLNHFTGTDRDLSWVHLLFLFVVSLMPFSTSLMSAFIFYRAALVVYWLNILLLGAVLFASWRLALRHGLVHGDAMERSTAIQLRIIMAQALYAFGALLCVYSTLLSLGFIVLVQLNYALAPKALRTLLP
jgi:uncharacterized membrane protein